MLRKCKIMQAGTRRQIDIGKEKRRSEDLLASSRNGVRSKIRIGKGEYKLRREREKHKRKEGIGSRKAAPYTRGLKGDLGGKFKVLEGKITAAERNRAR